jgi:hypothetical protein
VTCPKCNQQRAHRSHRSGLKDHLYRYLHYIPYRCKDCKARFYAYRAGETSSRMRTREEQKIMRLRRRIKWKRSKRELAIYLAGALLAGVTIFYLLQPRFE